MKIEDSQLIREWLIANDEMDPGADSETASKAAATAVAEGRLTAQSIEQLSKETKDKMTLAATSKEVFGTSEPAKGGPNVVGVEKQFKTHRPTGRHAKTGAEVELPSQFEHAKLGAYVKHIASRSGLNVQLNELDKKLLDYSAANDAWVGDIGNQHYTAENPLPAAQVKALLNDATSGGQEIVPAYLDNLIVLTPQLYGELLPYVQIIDVSYSANVQGASLGIPELTWNTTEGCTLAAVTTTGLMADVSTNIYPVACHIEIGRDFLADAVVGIGELVASEIGIGFAVEFDNVIATGSGSGQPTGLDIASGATTVNSANGAGGPVVLGDLEQLAFAVSKPLRNPAQQPSYVMSDTMYRRCRSVPRGSDDQARVNGMDHASYRLLEWPVRINNALANGTMMFSALRQYRFYRRQGAQTEFTTEGATLRQKNLALLSVRARVGGRPTLGSAVAVMTDAAQAG